MFVFWHIQHSSVLTMATTENGDLMKNHYLFFYYDLIYFDSFWLNYIDNGKHMGFVAIFTCYIYKTKLKLSWSHLCITHWCFPCRHVFMRHVCISCLIYFLGFLKKTLSWWEFEISVSWQLMDLRCVCVPDVNVIPTSGCASVFKAEKQIGWCLKEAGESQCHSWVSPLNPNLLAPYGMSRSSMGDCFASKVLCSVLLKVALVRKQVSPVYFAIVWAMSGCTAWAPRRCCFHKCLVKCNCLTTALSLVD